MYKIIGERNRVNYGSIDEPVDFNYQDFRLFNLFDREITGFRKKIALHVFNYIAVVSGDYLIGVAAVNIGAAANVFSFIYSYDKGKLYEFNAYMPAAKLHFPINPDEYEIRFEKNKGRLLITKSHSKGIVDLDLNFENKLVLKGSFPYSLKTHKPLRVLNPSCGDPHLFTFTEKCAPISPRFIEATFNGKALPLDPKKTMAIYDWSGGYLNRNTNWLWAAFGGFAQATTIGANFAALVNETFYSENAFWVNNKRTRVQRVIFDLDMLDPRASEWRIWSEDGAVDITVRHWGERREKSNFGIVKVNFRQFISSFSGRFKPPKGAAVKFKDIRGLSEIHFSVW